jgi:hypothetical protein
MLGTGIDDRDLARSERPRAARILEEEFEPGE